MKTHLLSKWKHDYWPLATFIVLFAILGVVLLFISKAATPYASIEGEGGNSSGSGTYAVNNSANASGGKYIQFGTKTSSSSSGPLGLSKALCTTGGANFNGSNSASCSTLTMPNNGSLLPACPSSGGTVACQATVTTGMATGNNPYPNCTANCSNEGFQIGIPPNLAVHDSSHPVPVFIVFPDACQRPYGCFNTGATDNGPDGMDAVAAANKIMVVDMFPDGTGWGTNPGQFTDPTMYGPLGQTCGTGVCDDAVLFHSIVNYLTSHYAIDPNYIMAGGGSKGGNMAADVLCDVNTEPLLSGIMDSSATWTSTGSSPSNGVPGSNGGSCPAIVSPNATPTSGTYLAASGTNSFGMKYPRPLMYLHVFSWEDATQNRTCNASSTNWSSLPPYVGQVPTGAPTGGNGDVTPPAWGCFAGGVDVANHWHYEGPEVLTRIVGPAFGCSSTPISTIGSVSQTGGAVDWQDKVSIITGTVRHINQMYSCNNGFRIGLSANGNIDNGSGCHAWSCTVVNADGSASSQALEDLTFFATGSPTAPNTN